MPALTISEEELSAKMEEILDRVQRTVDYFLHGGSAVCGVEVTARLLELLHIIDRRGHLLQDVRSRAIYFVEEAGQDFGTFLEQNPLFAPRSSSKGGDFVKSLWRSVSRKNLRACANWRRQRKRTDIRSPEDHSYSQKRSQTTSHSYYQIKNIQTSERVVSFPRP